MTSHGPLFEQLDDRRARLGLSKSQLARRSGVSEPAVRRLLAGAVERPEVDTLLALANALGVEVRLSGAAHVHESTAVAAFREQQARAKAVRLARLVQGTMALEADAVGDDVLRELEEQNVHALLAGPARRLWGD